MDNVGAVSYNVWRTQSWKDNLLTTPTTSTSSGQNSNEPYLKTSQETQKRYKKLSELPETLKMRLSRFIISAVQASCQLVRNVLIPSTHHEELRSRVLEAETKLSDWRRDIRTSLNFQSMSVTDPLLSEVSEHPTDLFSEITVILSLLDQSPVPRYPDPDHLQQTPSHHVLTHPNLTVSAEDLFDAYDVRTLDLRVQPVSDSPNFTDSIQVDKFSPFTDAGNQELVQQVSVIPVDKQDPQIPAHLSPYPINQRYTHQEYSSQWRDIILPKQFDGQPILSGFLWNRPSGNHSKFISSPTSVALYYIEENDKPLLPAAVVDIHQNPLCPIKFCTILPASQSPLILTVSDTEICTFTISTDTNSSSRLFQALKLSNPLVSGKFCYVPDHEDSNTAVLLHTDGTATLVQKGIPQGTFRGFLPPALIPYLGETGKEPSSNLPRLLMVCVRRDSQIAVAYSIVPGAMRGPKVVVSMLNFPPAKGSSDVTRQVPLLLHLELDFLKDQRIAGVALSSDAQHLLECTQLPTGTVLVRVLRIYQDKLSVCGHQTIVDDPKRTPVHFTRTRTRSTHFCSINCSTCVWCKEAQQLSFCKLAQDTYALFSILQGVHVLRFVSVTKQLQTVAHLELHELSHPISVLTYSDTEVLFVTTGSSARTTKVASLRVTW